jgi:NADH-quinone oxidoreductase subunit M
MLGLISATIFIPILGAGAIYLAGKASPRAARLGALVIALVTFLLALAIYGTILVTGSGGTFTLVEGPYPWIPALKGLDYYVGLDGLGAPLVLVSAFLTVLVVLGSWDLIDHHEAEYYALILLFEGAIIGVFSALNLVLFYVFWEVVLIPMFFFIGIWGGPRRRYAAMKFLLFTYVGSIIMLVGFLALYFFATPAGTFNITEYTAIPFWLQTLASIATFAGFGVKLPVVPLHTWLPDAHVEAPAPISVFLAGLLLKMGGYGFIRFNLLLFPDAARTYGLVYIAIGLITMFYGALVAMVQRDLKRMIALTSINHMGFVLLGAFTLSWIGVSGSIFQMFNHAAAIGLLFMLSGYIHEQAGTRDIPLLQGLKARMPRTATLLVLGGMAGMGVPLYSTFISEYMVVAGAIGYDPRLWFAVLVPGITAGYFLWMMKRTIMTPLAGGSGARHDLGLRSALALGLYLVPLVLFLVAPYLILDVIGPVADRVVSIMMGG